MQPLFGSIFLIPRPFFDFVTSQLGLVSTERELPFIERLLYTGYFVKSTTPCDEALLTPFYRRNQVTSPRVTVGDFHGGGIKIWGKTLRILVG